MIRKVIFFTAGVALFITLVLVAIVGYNELLYFTGWKDNVATPDNKAQVHFYVINLDRQPERFIKFKQQADKFGLNIERVSATDGYKITFVDHKTGQAFTGTDIKSGKKVFEPKQKYDVYCSTESYNNKEAPEFIYTAFEYIPRSLSAGELGIDCSSRLLWKKIAAAPKDQIAVIFEDDVILADDFAQKFSHFINALPTKWDIAYLGVKITKIKKHWDDTYLQPKILKIRKHFLYGMRWKWKIPTLTVNNYFTKIHNQVNLLDLHGYAVNKDSARRLTEAHNNDTSWPMDDAIARFVRKRTITAYVANETLAIQDETLPSSITEMGAR